MSEVQSVIFDKDKWTPLMADKWLNQHKFVNKKLHITDKYLRFRQKHPKYKRYVTKTLDNGVKLVIGFK